MPGPGTVKGAVKAAGMLADSASATKKVETVADAGKAIENAGDAAKAGSRGELSVLPQEH